MRLFAEIGYHPAGNAVIAEASGLTRGAMLYHFASREALLDAVIPHIQAARARLFESAAAAMPPGADRTDYAIDSYWRLLHEAPFVAFAELEAAARTDAPLRERLRGAQAAFDRNQMGEHMAVLVQAGETPRASRPAATSPASCWRDSPAPTWRTTQIRAPSGWSRWSSVRPGC